MGGGLLVHTSKQAAPASSSNIKMSIVTLLGVYPLSMLIPALVNPLTHGWPLWLQGLIIATLIVASLIWAVMPPSRDYSRNGCSAQAKEEERPVPVIVRRFVKSFMFQL